MAMSATETWHTNLRNIINGGQEVRPRGMLTREISPYMSWFDMTDPIVIAPERDLGYKFMSAEAAFILSGDNRVSTIAPYSKEISKFSDDGVTFFGSYGPRIVDQLQYVAKTLAEDLDSRQAVLEIWRPSPPKSKDIPCTCLIQWLIRGNKLNCIDTMRSSDTWLGWPYDSFAFSMVSLALLLRLRKAYKIDLELGTLTIVAGSQHLYERNFAQAEKVLHAYAATDPVGFRSLVKVDPGQFEDEDDLREALWDMANAHRNILDPESWRA